MMQSMSKSAASEAQDLGVHKVLLQKWDMSGSLFHRISQRVRGLREAGRVVGTCVMSQGRLRNIGECACWL